MTCVRISPYRSFLFALYMLSVMMPVSVYGQKSSGINWTFDGSLRYRFEKWDNMNALYYGNNPAMGTPDDNILLQRIIAGTTIHFMDNITLSFHMQDSRAFGWSLSQWKEPDAFKKHPQGSTDPYYIMNPQEEFFELYDAFIRIDNIFNLLTIKAGRQKIAFGDYRIFGPGSWGNTGRWTWDAVLVTMNRPLYSLNTWYGGTKIHDPLKTYFPFSHTEYQGGGVHFHLATEKYPGLEVYAAHKQQGSAAYIRDKKINRNWIGFRLFQPEKSNLQYETSLTYQFGKEENNRLNASGLFLKLGYKANQFSWKPTISLRYTRATGNNPETDGSEIFDPAFGASDRYYGWMNLVRWSNLDDREIMLEIYPEEGMRIELKYNQFRIPEHQDLVMMGNIILPFAEDHLGDEFDLYATYDLNEKWQFAAVLGYFFMKKGMTTEYDDPGNAWLISIQSQYKFKLGRSQ